MRNCVEIFEIVLGRAQWAGPNGPGPWAGPMGPRRGPAGARAPHRRKLSAKLFRKIHFLLDVPLKTKKNRGEIPCKTAKILNSNHFSKAQW